MCPTYIVFLWIVFFLHPVTIYGCETPEEQIRKEPPMLYIWLLIYLMASVVSSAVYLYLPAPVFVLPIGQPLTYFSENEAGNGCVFTSRGWRDNVMIHLIYKMASVGPRYASLNCLKLKPWKNPAEICACVVIHAKALHASVLYIECSMHDLLHWVKQTQIFLCCQSCLEWKNLFSFIFLFWRR